MPNRAQSAATLHAEIGAATYSAPPSATHAQILAALRAEGVLDATGAYRTGKGMADVVRAVTVPSVTQETLERLLKARGI